MPDTNRDEAFLTEDPEWSDEACHDFDMSRRGFLQLFGAGLLVTVTGGVSLGQRGKEKAGGTVAARLYIGKDGAIVLDHAGNHLHHGMVTRRLDYSLADAKAVSSPEPLGLRRCPACGLFFEPLQYACPECGWTPDRRTPDRSTPDRMTPDRSTPDRTTPDPLQTRTRPTLWISR